MTVRRLTFYLVISFIIPALAAFGFSKYYWGYYVSTPPIPFFEESVKSIESVSYIQEDATTGNVNIEAFDFSSGRFKELLLYYKDHPDAGVWGRLPIQIYNQNMAPDNIKTLPKEEVVLIIEKARSHGSFIKKGEQGYDYTKWLRGHIAKGLNVNGDTMVFACLRGQQVSNDHYPVYDFVFRIRTEGKYELIASQTYFEDIAGLEGLRIKELLKVFIGLWMVLTALTLFLFIISKVLDTKSGEAPGQSS